MTTTAQGESLQPTIDAIAKHLGWWNEQTQTPELNHELWTPDTNSEHCRLLASHLNIRYRSDAGLVRAYIGDAPDVSTGAIVSTAPVKSGDKAAAGRIATIACAFMWCQTPAQYRPAQTQPAQAQAPAPAADPGARIAAALAQFTAEDIATAVAVLTAIQQAKSQ